MNVCSLTADISVSPQIAPTDVATLLTLGFRSIVCHRPDAEAPDQPNFEEIAQAATAAGLKAVHQPVPAGQASDRQAAAFATLLAELPKPVLAYCRTGTRSATLWALSQTDKLSVVEIERALANAGYDLKAVVRRISNARVASLDVVDAEHTVVIVGAGAAGIAVASSLRTRDPSLDIAIIDPADVHYYQPGWTLVGAGIFAAADTARTMASRVPRGVHWLKAAVVGFEPDRHVVVLEGCRKVRYQRLVVCPGIKVDWHGVEGLVETLGHNGVTSNYRFDLAPYTAELVRALRGGKALFTQPPMPIKCAGAPQKAMYLSCDTWRRNGTLDKTQVQFFNAGAALFGVPDYVPALMEYVEAYGIDLKFSHTLKRIDGAQRRAVFDRALPDGSTDTVETDFDMIHVVPPQTAPDFVRASPLVNVAGWIDVDPGTLCHKSHEHIYALGDATSTTNAKTAAAARKQAPVVAHNVLASLGRVGGTATYDGYGSCPLTVERGKVVLAEFLYGGKVAPSFPAWLLDGKRPSRLAWFLKERILPPLYWDAMLKGREWMARPALADG
ncbi:TIGR01244 family phosphatase [Paraburkholderia sp. Tr-20389]|uniref:bifunctional protein tyrosine phosphatase family protein/NAD(P)/FAD-dependent oxidoreductase n=1 Tax=Paraburkholderia sp. Tr-20389 TaxID=2703903 RepID=UPI00197EF9F5|nr:bifunctional protein tyrosine phosphatase family protein/NAD(P)/FAD-dependent oxidoreductase [Paraburkholderia sp. Tr-20389]MBN3751595.1 TIGR01244 family phosphatase [Paraburkholderia sp. Tr-20389]